MPSQACLQSRQKGGILVQGSGEGELWSPIPPAELATWASPSTLAPTGDGEDLPLPKPQALLLLPAWPGLPVSWGSGQRLPSRRPARAPPRQGDSR